MPVLLIGGSGYVGAMVTPLLRQRFTPRIFRNLCRDTARMNRVTGR